MANYVDNGNKLDWALPFQRTGDFPIDRSSMFSSYADAVKYAKGDSTDPDSRGLQGSSYVGQIITVFENNVVNVYKIEADRSLTLVGAGAGGTDDYEDLENKPSINNVTLIGNKTSSDLGLASQASITDINSKIPNQASQNNQLADKEFVNSSISTATATFRGTFTSLNTLQSTEGDKNDYAFYSHQDSSGNTIYDRYKYVGPKKVILPAGYTQVDRISGNYINLNIAPRNDWHFILKVSSPYFAEWAPAVPVFGVQSGNKRYDMYKPSYEYPLFLKTTAGQWGIQVSNNDIHTIEVKSNRAMYIDGSLVATLSSTTNLPTIPVYLLGENSNGSAWKQNNVSCYGLTIYDNEENLLMDLVPCIRDQDGSIGVYDLAGTINPDTNSPFYGGATSSSPLSEEKWEYEYSLNNSSFTSEQWAAINSGVTSNTVSSVGTIETYIPSNASAVNQLADKDFVNSSVSTATATFRGTFTSLSSLQATDGDRNDYAFYNHTDSAGNTVYDRYKYVGIPETRVPVEYTEVYSIGRSVAVGAYINTGIVLKSNYTIETKMSFGAVGGYTNRYYFGAADTNDNYFYLQKPERSVLRIASSAGNSSNASIVDDTEYLIEVKNNKYYVNGSVYGNAVVPNIGDDYPLYLFGYNNQGSGNSNGNITVSFHSFKVWNDEGELILDLVPCLNYENQAGMYDVVSGAFLTGGSYSTVPLTTDRWVFEYSLNNSSFTAQQWATINSGLTSQTATDVSNINAMIPVQASSNNQLADKDYVDSAISTATATFRGTFTNLQTLQNTDGDRNDYAFYSHQDTAGNTIYDRYKYVGLPASRVPDGYTEMLFLQKPRNGTAYIDTGYKIQSTDKIYMKCYGWEYEATSYIVFGAIDSNNKYFRVEKQYLGGGAYIESSNGSIYAAQLYNNTAIIECYDGKVYASDLNGDNKTLKGNLTLDTVDTNLFLFAYNNNDSSISRYPQWVKIGDFIVYDQNDNKKLELVPCSDSLGNNGYYDTVSGRFITPTSGTLSAQSITTDKWLFEYSLNNSSFTSSQWNTINSGLASHVTSTGYDATKTQVLKNVNGTLMWQDET